MHLCVVCRQPILFDDVEELYAYNSRGSKVMYRPEIKNLICNECLEKGWLLSFDGTPVQLKNEPPKKGSTSNMSELISAEEARRKSDEGREKAVASEIAKIKYLIEAATERGEYFITLPEGKGIWGDTADLLMDKGYSCKFVNAGYQNLSLVISWSDRSTKP